MAKGKQTCKILKEIRKQIAAENDIELIVSECTYQGDCRGTCPKCEAEVRYLERELEKRQRMGKAAVFAGMTLGTLFAATACNDPLRPLQGDVPCPTPDSTELLNDTVPHDTLLLESDVVASVPDTPEEDKKLAFKGNERFEIVGEIMEEGEAEYVSPMTDVVEDPENEVYQIVEQMPQFPGGVSLMMEYVREHTVYPEEAKKKGIQGRVYVSFVVETDGSISNAKVLRGIGNGCDEEAIRVVESMPKWSPGVHKGETVRVSYQIPLLFMLEDTQE